LLPGFFVLMLADQLREEVKVLALIIVHGCAGLLGWHTIVARR
jgi:hypothetical protein